MTPSGRRKKALLITANYGCGNLSGGSQRTDLIFRALKSEYDVDVLIIGSIIGDMHRAAFAGASEIHEANYAEPGEAGLWKIVRPANSKLVDKIATAVSPRRLMYNADKKMNKSLRNTDLSAYDFIVGRYLRPTARTGILERADAPPVLIDVDDRDDLVLLSQLGKYKKNPLMNALFHNHIKQIKSIMAAKLPKAAHLWLSSEEDREGLAHPSISVLPNIPYYAQPTAPRRSPDSDSPIVLFVGSGGYQANQAGLARFLKQCWPAINAAVPQASLRIVGAGWENLHQSFGALSGVEVAGRVDDLAEEYARATIAVSPVYEGGGTKIKVLEALSFGVPIVAASHSARGFSERLKQEGIMSAESDEEMIKSCTTMLNDPALCAQYAKRGRAIVNEIYSFDGFKSRVVADCEAVLMPGGKTD